MSLVQVATNDVRIKTVAVIISTISPAADVNMTKVTYPTRYMFFRGAS
jgi:hypothetical protein